MVLKCSNLEATTLDPRQRLYGEKHSEKHLANSPYRKIDMSACGPLYLSKRPPPPCRREAGLPRISC